MVIVREVFLSFMIIFVLSYFSDIGCSVADLSRKKTDSKIKNPIILGSPKTFIYDPFALVATR